MHCQLRPGNHGPGDRGLVDRAVAERVASIQRRSDSPLQRGEDSALIPKSHFSLRRMDVHIDELRIDTDVDHGEWVPAALQPALVALFERVHERSGADRPAVDGDHHAIAAAAAQPRLADHAGDKRHPDHLEHLGGDGRTVNGRDRAPPITVSAAAHCGAAVNREVKPDMRMKQRESAHHLLDRSHLGGVALQELQPRRNVCEEVPHLNDHARQQGSGALLDDLARTDAHRGAAAGALDIGDRRDARQRLTAKAE